MSVGAPWGYPNVVELPPIPHGLYYSSSESSIDSGLDSPIGPPDRECANGSVSSSRGSPLNLSEAIAANSLSAMLVSKDTFPMNCKIPFLFVGNRATCLLARTPQKCHHTVNWTRWILLVWRPCHPLLPRPPTSSSLCCPQIPLQWHCSSSRNPVHCRSVPPFPLQFFPRTP